MTPQEKGTTKAAALPYQLRANAHLTGKRIAIKMSAGSYVFAEKSASAPYSVYAPSNFTDNTETERCRNWWFAVNRQMESVMNGHLRLSMKGFINCIYTVT